MEYAAHPGEPPMMKPIDFPVGALAFLLLHACAPDSSGPQHAEHTVQSSDGLATLVLSADALPSGVDPDEIAIVPIDPPEDIVMTGGTLMDRAYQLLPDGLQLEAPATVTLSMTWDEVSEGVGVLHAYGDRMEMITDVRVDVHEDETATVSFQVDHFSICISSRVDAGINADIVSPPWGSYAIVGEPFDVHVEVTYAPGTCITVTERGILDDYNMVEKTLRDEPWRISKGKSTTSDGLSPKTLEDVPSFHEVDAHSFSIDYQLTCVADGPQAIIWDGDVEAFFDCVHRDRTGQVFYENRTLHFIDLQSIRMITCVAPDQTCEHLEDAQCVEDSDCSSERGCSNPPDCECVCSQARGAECDSHGDCGAHMICNQEYCGCECSRDAGAECDGGGGCTDPKARNLASCECVCQTALGADCESDDDCFGSTPTCNLDTCTCVEATCEPDDCPPENTSLILGGFHDAHIEFVDVGDDGETMHSDGEQTAKPEPAQKIEGLASVVIEGDSVFETIDEVFPCGAGALGTTVCAWSDEPPTGAWAAIVAQFAGEIPFDDDVYWFQYGVVFDADGDTTNNYVPSEAYPNDFWAGTDLWYQLRDTPNVEWEVLVHDHQLRSGIPSNARFVIAGSELGLFVPVSELQLPDSTFRVTSFSHTGDWGATGVWSGDYYPQVGEPLEPVSTTVIE